MKPHSKNQTLLSVKGLLALAVMAGLTITNLTGCSSLSSETTDNVTNADQAAPDPQPELAEEPREYPQRPFPPETLYELLVAEVAGARNQYGIALTKYAAQAEETRDPEVVARAAKIAAYLRADSYTLKLSQLWTEVDPDNFEAHRFAAHYFSQARQLTNAWPHALFLLERGESEPVRNVVVQANGASDVQRSQLVKLFDALPEPLATLPDVLISYATLLWHQRLSDPALEKARAIPPEEAQFESAQLLISEILQHQKKTDEALESLKSALDTHPKSKRLRLQSARLWAGKDLDRAHQELTTLVDYYPQDHSLIYSLALVSVELGLDEEAEQLFHSLLNSEEKGSEAHFQLGKLLQERGNQDQAASHYRQVRSGSMLIAAASRLSLLLQQQDRTDDGRNYLEQLRNEQPEQAAVLHQVESEMLEQAGLFSQAYLSLSKALELKPGDAQLLYARSLLSERQGDFLLAESDLRTIIERQPNNAMSLNALGYLLTNHTDRYQEAYQLITRALEINPNDAPTIDSLGWVLYKLGRHDEAIEQLQKALEVLPDPEVAAHLGEVLWQAGRRDEALAVWKKSLSANPDSPVVIQTMERLQALE